MKLYNLYKEVILEEINQFNLEEAITKNIEGVFLNGDPDKRVHYMVDIKYKDEDGEITNRWICIGHVVTTKKGNQAISAYVVTGNKQKEIKSSVNSQGTELEVNQINATDPADWRLFIIDNILEFKESKVRVYEAPVKYEENGWTSDKGPVSNRNLSATFDFKKGETPYQKQQKQQQQQQQQNNTVNNQNNELNK
jgi:hypothetical protein